jgi:hypothetical protein
MNAPFLNGAPSPRDPFQGGRAPVAADILALGRQWDDLTRQIDDDDAYRRAELAAPPFGGDIRSKRLWGERAVIEAQITANAEASVEAIAVKLRMVAWHLHVAEGGGTNELTDEERAIASALADAERLAERARI